MSNFVICQLFSTNNILRRFSSSRTISLNSPSILNNKSFRCTLPTLSATLNFQIQPKRNFFTQPFPDSSTSYALSIALYLIVLGTFNDTSNLTKKEYYRRFYERYISDKQDYLIIPLLFGLYFLYNYEKKNPITGEYRLLVNSSNIKHSTQFDRLTKLNQSNDVLVREDKVGKILNKFQYFLAASNEIELYVSSIDNPQFSAVLHSNNKLVLSQSMLKLINEDIDLLPALLSHLIAHNLSQHNHQVSYYRLLDFTNTELPTLPTKWYNIFQVVTSFKEVFFFMLTPVSNFYYPTSSEYPCSTLMEKEADVLAMHILARTGYHPNLLLKFWDKIDALDLDTSYNFYRKLDQNRNQNGVDIKMEQLDLLEFHQIHKSYKDRGKVLKFTLAQALQVYNQADETENTVTVERVEDIYGCKYLMKSLKSLKI